MLWRISDRCLFLITPDQLCRLPLGTILYDIFMTKYTIGKDKIDEDTRFGYLAYGFLIDESGGKIPNGTL
jgi:hypothetical protein